MRNYNQRLNFYKLDWKWQLLKWDKISKNYNEDMTNDYKILKKV